MRINFLVSFLAAIAIYVTSDAQERISFKLVEQKELGDFSDRAIKEYFGGISAVDLMPISVLPMPLLKATKQTTDTEVLILFSDHYPNEVKNSEEHQNSYYFTLNGRNIPYSSGIFYGSNNIESVRYNPFLNQIYFAFEKDDTSGVGYISNPGKENYSRNVLFQEKNRYNNRGIEGITFSSDNKLWVAFEAGNTQTCGYSNPIYCINYDGIKHQYDYNKRLEYQYPFDKCRCLNKELCDSFNGNIGNGVSEILALKNERDKILVLERCFDGRNGNVRLYLAGIEEGAYTLSKQLVFDFNDPKNFPEKHKSFKPQNIEGMAWGKDEEGASILYLFTDNNFNPALKNQVIKLKMLKG
jgi:hypothetical protein